MAHVHTSTSDARVYGLMFVSHIPVRLFSLILVQWLLYLLLCWYYSFYVVCVSVPIMFQFAGFSLILVQWKSHYFYVFVFTLYVLVFQFLRRPVGCGYIDSVTILELYTSISLCCVCPSGWCDVSSYLF